MMQSMALIIVESNSSGICNGSTGWRA